MVLVDHPYYSNHNNVNKHVRSNMVKVYNADNSLIFTGSEDEYDKLMQHGLIEFTDRVMLC